MEEYKNYDNSDIKEKEEEFSIEDYLFILNRRKWIVIIITLVILITGLLYTNSKTRIYTSMCEIYANQNKNNSVFGADQLMAVASIANMNSNSVEMVSKLITNSDNLEYAYENLTVKEKEGFNGRISPSNIKVTELEKGSSIYCIEVKSMDPNSSARVANLLAQKYFDNEAINYNQYSSKAQIQIQEELGKILDKVDKVRDKMVTLKQKTGIYNIEIDLQAKVQNKYTIEQTLDQQIIELAALETQYNETKNEINSLPKAIKTQTEQSVTNVQAIALRLDTLTSDRAALLEKFTSSAPEIKEIDKKIAYEKSKLEDAKNNTFIANTYQIIDNPKIEELKALAVDLKVQISAKKTSINKTKELLNKTGQSLQSVPIDEAELAKVTEEYQILKDNMGLLQSNYYRLAFNSQSDYNIGRVIFDAVPNPVPTEPNIPKSFVIFLIAGLVVGFFCALVADNLDNIIYDDTSMKKLTFLPCLTKIPYINTSDGSKLQIGKLTGHSNFLEAFRIFRNNIMLTEIISESHGINKNKTFAITGPDAKQGKSTASSNLAIAMALDGNKVLLIDADLRKPNVAKFFNVPNDKGYTTLVKGTTTMEESITKSSVENLDLLTTGPLPPNPTEFLNSQENREWVRRLQNEYDVVIFDTSPCSFISDAQIVTTFVDAVVMVITVKTTRIPVVKTSLEQLNLVKAPVIGYVLNKVQADKSRKDYYYNYYYYATDDKD